jgi:hypothetical protein
VCEWASDSQRWPVHRCGLAIVRDSFVSTYLRVRACADGGRFPVVRVSAINVCIKTASQRLFLMHNNLSLVCGSPTLAIEHNGALLGVGLILSGELVRKERSLSMLIELFLFGYPFLNREVLRGNQIAAAFNRLAGLALKL